MYLKSFPSVEDLVSLLFSCFHVSCWTVLVFYVLPVVTLYLVNAGFQCSDTWKEGAIVLFSLHVAEDLIFHFWLTDIVCRAHQFLTNFGPCNLLTLPLLQKYPHEGIEDIFKRPGFYPLEFLFELVPSKRMCMLIPSSIACVRALWRVWKWLCSH